MKYLSIEDYQSSIFCLNSDKEDIEKYISLAEQDLELSLIIPNKVTDRQLEIIKRVLVQHTDFIIVKLHKKTTKGGLSSVVANVDVCPKCYDKLKELLQLDGSK
jgi:hypothetical protein